MTVRTRFAPSPTGLLHLGNIRLAVFNWLFARHHGGAFVVRIEDTDPDRTVPGSEASILEDLRWLGLDWDEGPDRPGAHGPCRQSERLKLYRGAANRLMDAGRAYRCYCTHDDLAEEGERTTGGVVHRYPGRCRFLTADERRLREAQGRPSVVRFALPAGAEGVAVDDAIRGRVTFPLAPFDDFVLLRADGRPTYNFAVVVDDAGMEITHVMRGAGHLSNTPKQVLLFEALDHPAPVFAHLPTVLAPGGGKLSKRTGAASVRALREAGYHPDGVVNYLSLLGWSAPDDREVLTRAELVELIGLDRVGASDTTYDPAKLRWMSGQHLRRMDAGALTEALRPFLDLERFSLEGERLGATVEALASRLETLTDITGHVETFLHPPRVVLERGREDVRNDPGARTVVQTVARMLQELEEWTAPGVSGAVRAAGSELGVRGADLFHPVRRALSGSESGPDLGQVAVALGRAETLTRLAETLEGRGV